MSATDHLLDTLANRQGTLISNLRLIPAYRTGAFRCLCGMTEEQKRAIPLTDWQETFTYLTGAGASVNSYADINTILQNGCSLPEAQSNKERL